MEEPLPEKTMRDLGALLDHFADLIWRATKTFIKQIAPFVRPPSDMEVWTRDGGQYTGVVVVEANDVTAGLVTRIGQDTPRHGAPAYQRPLPTMERDPGSIHDRGSALRHWATDPRDDEGEPWRR